MLAAVITADDLERAVDDLKQTKSADLIEIRADYLRGLDAGRLEKAIKLCKKPAIVTIRKKSEGGFFNGSEIDRFSMLKKSIGLGAFCIDIEYSLGKSHIKDLIKGRKNAKIILSYHNFKETPESLNSIYGKIKKFEPDFIKIATKANTATDPCKIFDLIKSANKEKRKIIAFCMGQYGQPSRILSLILGSQITYASISREKESASGQLTLGEMNDVYRIKKINRNTKIAGLIGNPVEHSWSHIIHNAAFDKIDFNAVYLKFRVDKLKEFIEYFRKLNLIGFSVTIPHKVEVINYLDKVDKKAKAIGAVNTIVVENKKLVGYNTDCDGAMQALKEKAELKGKNIAILGAGGSARALTYGLKEEGAGKITIVNRTIEKAKYLAGCFNCNYGSLGDLKGIDYDILVNTTSVGMHPNFNRSPITPNLIKKNALVFDIVFNPYKTRLLKDAEERGCTIIPGFEMLINGAVRQFKLWTGKEAPGQLMRKKVMEYLKNAGHQN